MTMYLVLSAFTSSPISLLATTKALRFALCIYEGWNFNSGNYLFTTDTK